MTGPTTLSIVINILSSIGTSSYLAYQQHRRDQAPKGNCPVCKDAPVCDLDFKAFEGRVDKLLPAADKIVASDSSGVQWWLVLGLSLLFVGQVIYAGYLRHCAGEIDIRPLPRRSPVASEDPTSTGVSDISARDHGSGFTGGRKFRVLGPDSGRPGVSGTS